VIAAAVFVVFSAAIVAFARHFRSTAEAALSEDPAEEVEPARPRQHQGPLTVKSAVNARELLAALRDAFGANGRGQPCVSYVDYDRQGDRLHVTLALDDVDPKAPGAKAGALRRMREVLEAIHDGEMRWQWVLVTATAAVPDRTGAPNESTVLRTLFARDRLHTLDWPKTTPDTLAATAEQFWAYADLAN